MARRLVADGAVSMTSEYIERVLDTAQPDDWVLLQNEVNLVPEIIRRAHEKELRVVFNPSPMPENSMHCRLRVRQPVYGE